VGPERPTFIELVNSIKDAVESRSFDRHMPGDALLIFRASWAWHYGESLKLGDEYRAMADGLADTDGPATGSIALSDWLVNHRSELGRHVRNELKRHFDVASDNDDSERVVTSCRSDLLGRVTTTGVVVIFQSRSSESSLSKSTVRPSVGGSR